MNDNVTEHLPLDSGEDNTYARHNTVAATSDPIPHWRLWLYRLIAVTLIPVAVLFILEISLRLIGYGYPASAMVKTTWNGQTAYCNNYQFGWRFWPPSIARESEPYTITARKSEDTYRIFILGGSAALGTPEPAYAFSRLLEAMLENQYPQVNFEVINTAITAINSHVVLPIAKTCSSKNGDLFIVYLGNNEVIGPYGAGTIFARFSNNMTFIRLDMAIQTTRLGQLFKTLVDRKRSDKSIPRVWGGTEMFMENLIHKDDKNLQIVYDHFKTNLEDITKTLIKSEAQVILCSVGSNIKDSAPFASLHRSNITDEEKEKWNDLYERGIDYEVSVQYNEAIESYLAAAMIDETYADLRFRTAGAYWALGDFKKAREEYIFAREFDALRLRADNRINQIIHEVAESNKEKGVSFINSVSILERHSPHNAPGEELLYEHVHMNFKGNYILASAVLQQVERMLPESIKSKRVDRPVFTEEQCMDRLAFTDWDRTLLFQKLLDTSIKKAPFTSRLHNDDLIASLEQKLNILKDRCDVSALKAVEERYIKVITDNPDDWWVHWKYGQLLTQGLNKAQEGAEEYLKVTQLQPKYYAAYTTHALAMFSLGDFDNAINSGLKALEINPLDADAHHIIGISLLEKGDVDDAMEYFSTEVRIRPDHSQGFNRMGVILDKQGNIKEAEEVYRKGLTFSPDDVALHYNLVLLLAKQNRLNEAINNLQDALKLNPHSVELQELLYKIKDARRQP